MCLINYVCVCGYQCTDVCVYDLGTKQNGQQTEQSWRVYYYKSYATSLIGLTALFALKHQLGPGDELVVHLTHHAQMICDVNHIICTAAFAAVKPRHRTNLSDLT